MTASSQPMRRIHALFAFDASIDPVAFARSCRDWGIDTAILHPGFFRDERMADALRKEGLALWLNLPVFFNQEHLERHPDDYTITSGGRRAVKEWLHFVCPSRVSYRAAFVRDLRALLSRVSPEIVSLDFIRHFVFWEAVRLDGSPQQIEDGCYCPVCLAAFAAHCGERIDPANVAARVRAELGGAWGDWKCREIADFADQLLDEIRALVPNARLSIKTVPWRESDLDGAIRHFAGQDVRAMTRKVDVASPMAFTHVLRQTPDWKRGLLRHVATATGKPVLSYVQTEKLYRPEDITLAQFEAEVVEALAPEWAGALFFEYAQLAANPEKAAILRRHLRER